MDSKKLYNDLFKYKSLNLIDVFGLVGSLRKDINESLRTIGLDPLPNEVYLYPDVIKHLEKIKANFEERIKELENNKERVTDDTGIFLSKEELNVRIRRIDDLIGNVDRDLKVLKLYRDTYELNKDIRDTSDLNERLLIDCTNLNESVTENERHDFSIFIHLLISRIKNDRGAYLKKYDESELKADLRKQWAYMKTLPVVIELVKASVFRTFEEIDAVLA